MVFTNRWLREDKTIRSWIPVLDSLWHRKVYLSDSVRMGPGLQYHEPPVIAVPRQLSARDTFYPGVVKLKIKGLFICQIY